MITLHNQLDVDRPIAEVYDFIVNVEDAPKWQPAVLETTRITPGPLQVGSQFREVAKLGNRRVDTLCEVLELEPLQRITFKGSSPSSPMSYKTTYTLEAKGDATRITIVGNFSFTGLWRLVEFIIKSEVSKESQQEAQAMKAAIESRNVMSDK